MILPIIAYGHNILRERCKNVDKDHYTLDELISNMWETMHNANGCGLAAPQVGHPLRLFVVDSKTTFENLDTADQETYFDKNDSGIKETFINAEIIERSEKTWEDEEGCLSIPGLLQKVKRNWKIKIRYFNKEFEPQTRIFSGATARMIQHEYDHTKGVIFLDYLKPLTKRLLNSKLKKIEKGKIKIKYPMKFI